MAKEKRDLKNSKFTTGQLFSWESWLTLKDGDLLDRNGKKITMNSPWLGQEVYPDMDAVVVVGDNLRAAAEAAKYLSKYYNKYGFYPKVLCVPGFSLPTWLRYETPTVEWIKRILKALDIPEDVIENNFVVEKQVPAEAIRDFVLTTDWGKIAVFSSRGYSLPVAQQLYCLLPEIKWYFNDNKPVLPEDRIFRSEIVAPEGLAIDLMLAAIVRTCRDLGTRRLKLSNNASESHPDIELMQKMVARGYVGGLSSFFDWEYFNVPAKEGIKQVFIRRDDFPVSMGSDEDIMSCVNKLIEQYRE